MKNILSIVLISLLTISCGSRDKIEIFSSQLITALSEMDSNELKILFSDDGNYDRDIRDVKNEFIKKGLEGWPKIEAKGYMLEDEEDEYGERELTIFCTDGYGGYFEIHNLEMSKDGEDITSRLDRRFDIDSAWPKKVTIQEEYLDVYEKIIWFD